MVPTAHRLASRYPGVARKASPGAIVIIRPVGASTVIGDASPGNSKAQISPSPPHSDRNRIASSGGTRRSTEARLTLAGRLPLVIRACVRPVAMAGRPTLSWGGDRYRWNGFRNSETYALGYAKPRRLCQALSR